MPPDDSRDTILRRRMFFVSSALTVLTASTAGCPPQQTQPPTPTPVASVPTSTSTAEPDPVPDPEPPPKPSSLPPLDVPAGVNETAKAHYERLATIVPQIHEKLDAAEKEAASPCDILDPSCKVWESLAAQLAAVDDQRRDLSPRCGGSSADARAFDERLELHQKVIQERIDAIQKGLQKRLDAAAKKQRWAEQQEAAAVPQPCLKFRCDEW
jgi:hypothetical protein